MIVKLSGDSLRYHAERLLDTLGDSFPVLPDGTSAQEIAEELRIYQAELDIQNQELQSANQALEALQQHYAALFQQLPIPGLVVSSTGAILEANQAAHQQFSPVLKGVNQPSLYRLLADRSDATLSDLMKRSIATGEDGQVEVVLRDVHGQAHPFMAFVHDMPGARPMGHKLLLLLVDRSAEHREQVSMRQLREERNRLASVIWGTGVGTWEWNVQTGDVRFNEQWAAILGYTLAELEPVTIGTWMRFCHPDDLQRSEEQLQRHFNGEVDYYECEARMQHRNGRWLWILDRGRLISRTADGRPEWMAGTHLDITSRKQLEVQLSQLASHDSLTGLPRRELLADRLTLAMAQARRRQTRIAVAFIDLDGFKAINDQHGHEAGDAMLMETARRMTSLLRSGDTVARLGGDEFVMLMVDLQPQDDALPQIERVMAAVAEPVFFDGHWLSVTCSVGVTYCPVEEEMTVDGLLRRADRAMYQAKAQGKNRVCVG